MTDDDVSIRLVGRVGREGDALGGRPVLLGRIDGGLSDQGELRVLLIREEARGAGQGGGVRGDLELLVGPADVGRVDRQADQGDEQEACDGDGDGDGAGAACAERGGPARGDVQFHGASLGAR